MVLENNYSMVNVIVMLMV